MKTFNLTLTEEEACIVRDALKELCQVQRSRPVVTDAARRRVLLTRALYEQLRDKIAVP